MKRYLTDKQIYVLRSALVTIVVYLVFRYLIPLLMPFLIAFLLSWLIRPAVRFLRKVFRIPMGIGAGLVLMGVLALMITAGYYVGTLVADQLMGLGQQLPDLWESFSRWLWDRCGYMENALNLQEGTISLRIGHWVNGFSQAGQNGDTPLGAEQMWGVIENSFQGATDFLRMLVSVVVTLFVTIGATLITTNQLESLRRSIDRSLFGKEIHYVCGILARVGVAYGKTQLVIILCTVVISGVGLSILKVPYALLWALAVGVVDALPIFGAGTILWPWLIISLFRRQWVQAVGLTVMYAVCNLTRQWLEARYMGDRIGISPLENLMAVYVGLKLFGILGLFLGPIGYLLIRESIAPKEYT